MKTYGEIESAMRQNQRLMQVWTVICLNWPSVCVSIMSLNKDNLWIMYIMWIHWPSTPRIRSTQYTLSYFYHIKLVSSWIFRLGVNSEVVPVRLVTDTWRKLLEVNPYRDLPRFVRSGSRNKTKILFLSDGIKYRKSESSQTYLTERNKVSSFRDKKYNM